jgi:membrane protease YdiL (CAAX protease family)
MREAAATSSTSGQAGSESGQTSDVIAQTASESDTGAVSGPPEVMSGHQPRVRRSRPRGAIGQVVLFLAVWFTLVSIFGLLAALPTLLAAVEQSGEIVTGPDGSIGGSISVNLGEDAAGALMSASSTATLAVAAATLLATVLSVWIMRRWFDGPALLDLGLRRRPGWLADSLLGLALGPVMFLAILLLLLALGWAAVSGGTIDGRSLLVAFGTYVLVAFSEEILARGWILQVLLRGRGTRAAVIGSAGIFALLHAFNPGFGLTALLGLFAAGLLFAQAYLVTRQLWLPVALHLSWNFSEGPIFGFPVSGLPGSGLLTVEPTGPDMVTGGAFGPEAGLVLLVGIAVASGGLYALGRWRGGNGPGTMRQVEPAAPGLG